ncbi:hypothetical protein LWI29_033129 [Acer saccharum]|uniref:CCHC-type domain-containing protein n=1 Tax=Acer saccharum TaxID=4024 RepID=A0AA39SSB2_ACESA|nr:hypothetical protein LWI29_033129 [Acer saccharum]
MGFIFTEFLGDPDQYYKQVRQEFFDMRCCSLRRKDIEFHYQKMSRRFHTLGGINDPSLKQVYVNSFPEELQDEIQRKIDPSGQSLNDTTLGELHMYALSALDNLCATQKFFSKMLIEGRSCKTKKRHHFKSFKHKCGKAKRIKFYKKKAKRGWNKSQRCYICGKPGHYAKKCPNKKAKSARLVQQLKEIADEVPSDADIESIFSEQDTADHSTTFVLQEDSSDSEYLDSSSLSCFVHESYQASQISTHFGPQAPVQILPDKYSKPVDVIAYFDIGSHTTMMNPKILPPECWKPYVYHFRAVDGKVFSTNLISRKKIGIKLFPSFTLWVQVIGTPLPDKDILIGWDVFRQSKSLRILPTGIRFKRHFKSFSEIPKIFPLSEIQPPFDQIQANLLRLCADDHATFSHPSPLWKNPDFFIKLPFKLNEDINPTKASHSGMSPIDLQMAHKECNELLRQGLIEHTSSPWACQAFYVEKCSELK